jgi:hypothetical protein
LSNSHDGRSSLQLKFTPVRVVCSNTLTLALSRGQAVTIHHRRDVLKRLKAAHVELGLRNYVVRPAEGQDATAQADQIEQLLSDGFASLEGVFARMRERKLDDTQWSHYFSTVFPDPEHDERDKAGQMARARALASHLGRVGDGNQSKDVRNSLWAAYNGVTDFIDHRSPGRRDRSSAAADKHLRSIWFGQGANVKGLAYRRAIEMLAVPMSLS